MSSIQLNGNFHCKPFWNYKSNQRITSTHCGMQENVLVSVFVCLPFFFCVRFYFILFHLLLVSVCHQICTNLCILFLFRLQICVLCVAEPDYSGDNQEKCPRAPRFLESIIILSLLCRCIALHIRLVSKI